MSAMRNDAVSNNSIGSIWGSRWPSDQNYYFGWYRFSAESTVQHL